MKEEQFSLSEQLHVKICKEVTNGKADIGVRQLEIKISFITGKAE